MPLTSKLRIAVTATQTNPLDLGTAAASITKDYAVALASGVGAGQADRIFHDTRTLIASATEDIDLAGVLVDALGGAMSLARVKGLIVAASALNTNNVVVGGAATNGFVSWVGGALHTVTVRPGGVLALFSGQGDALGYPVTAATGDLLRIANSGATTPVIYDIIVIGAAT